ncbi:hypothetical protein RIF29_41352 [Crotalaria pallida]|uniref:Uncharacterized protein n=1 Tax=Crotalaria pallida TaxID=3830 RepID=A0AAN9E4W6_CROPI
MISKSSSFICLRQSLWAPLSSSINQHLLLLLFQSPSSPHPTCHRCSAKDHRSCPYLAISDHHHPHGLTQGKTTARPWPSLAVARVRSLFPPHQMLATICCFFKGSRRNLNIYEKLEGAKVRMQLLQVDLMEEGSFDKASSIV